MSQPLASWSHRDLESIITLLKDAETELANVTDDADLPKALRAHANEASGLIKAAKHLLKNVRARQEDILDEQTQTHTETETDATAGPGGRDLARNRGIGKHQTETIAD